MSDVEVLIVGGGACGVMAALAARAQGADVVVLERDSLARGSTALSSGFVPAAQTRVQQQAGVDDSIERFAADIRAKAAGGADPAKAASGADPELTDLFTREIAAVIDWLGEVHHIPFELLDGFLYPGHSRARMHAVPERTGEALIDRLWSAADRLDVTLLTDARVTQLLLGVAGLPKGVEYARPDGSTESVFSENIVLACNGFGGNPAMVREFIPEMSQAMYFGHAGNQGDAIRWGRELDLRLADTAACQGHGSVAHPHGVLISWAVIMEGGVQLNSAARRFWNESEGYSEAALAVLAQEGGIAWNLYDERIHQLALQFPDYQRAMAAGAIKSAPSLGKLAAALRLDPTVIQAELNDIGTAATSAQDDRFGRRFESRQVLKAPFYAVRVTGALFHTQGGLAVDTSMRVRRRSGEVIANLFAAGGAARGVSGNTVSGYLSGNGLLAAMAGGFVAGREAATRRVRAIAPDRQLT